MKPDALIWLSGFVSLDAFKTGKLRPVFRVLL